MLPDNRNRNIKYNISERENNNKVFYEIKNTFPKGLTQTIKPPD